MHVRSLAVLALLFPALTLAALAANEPNGTPALVKKHFIFKYHSSTAGALSFFLPSIFSSG